MGRRECWGDLEVFGSVILYFFTFYLTTAAVAYAVEHRKAGSMNDGFKRI
jgi:hypothetical protein